MSDTPTAPGTPIPSAADIIAHAGKQPLPALLDLNGDGVPDYQQSWLWDRVATGLVKLVLFLAPNSPWALLLQRYQPDIHALIEKGLP